MDTFRFQRGRGKFSRGRGSFRGEPFRGKFPRGQAFGNRPFGRPFNRPHHDFKRNDAFQSKEFKRGGSYNRSETTKSAQFIGEVLQECDLGITEYISPHEGFSGIIKARYSDFHVNEIDLDGVVAKLTTQDAPEDPITIVDEDDEELIGRYCYEHLPIEIWDKIHALVQKTEPSNEKVEVDVTLKTKEERTKIHEAVKSVFGSKIVGSTVVKDGIKYVTFVKYSENIKIDRRQKWPKERGDYVYFLVHKEYFDTLEAAMRIAETLRIKVSMLSYAGTKDRRAMTTQWFCVRRIDPKALLENCAKLKNIHLGNFCYKQQVLKLGNLKGNRFRIALRNVTAELSVMKTAVEALQEHGFLNYYGLQRFGNSPEVPTYEIGKQLLKGNWRKACSLILQPRKHESDRHAARAKLVYTDFGDAKRALAAIGPNRERTVEGKLLQGLSKYHDNDYVNALENIPRNMRLLYIHAYQSLIWNKILSRRIKEFGLTPIVGDLVLIDPNYNQDLYSPDDERTDMPEAKSDEQTNTSTDNEKPDKVEVKIITEADLNKYTIYDIVLPLPGFDVQYPNNVIKEWYKELLEADGLELAMTKIKVRTYCVSGAYRKCICKVDSFSWSTMKYNDPLIPVIRSDYEEMSSRPVPENIEDGKYTALILDFCLPSSSYATMALREVLKTDTSRSAHAKLNDYFDKYTINAASTDETNEASSDSQSGPIESECTKAKEQPKVGPNANVDSKNDGEEIIDDSVIVELVKPQLTEKISESTDSESAPTITESTENKEGEIIIDITSSPKANSVLTNDPLPENNPENLKRKVVEETTDKETVKRLKVASSGEIPNEPEIVK